MIPVSEALDVVLGAVRERPVEEVSLAAALGRVLGAAVVAEVDVPAFANSQMDGYAIRAVDLERASEVAPARLRVLGTIPAGRPADLSVSPGTAARIMTGAMIPPGADAVVRLEDVSVGDGGGTVWVPLTVAPAHFVRPAGEDMRAGERILEAGRVLGPADLGLLASLGRPLARVTTRPRVAILPTGDELVPLGRPLAPGQIHDSNAHVLAAAVAEVGGDAVVLEVAPDEPAGLRRSLEAALAFDFVLTTGGVSVGDFDLVKEMVESLGLQRRFWQVAQKPGKPLAFAERDGRLWFGLPGNPVSAMVCFALYVAPALRRSLRASAAFAPRVRVRMEASVRTARELTEFVRCRLGEDASGRKLAGSTGTQSSGALRSLSLADALVISPPGVAELRSGDEADALLLGPRPLSEHSPFATLASSASGRT